MIPGIRRVTRGWMVSGGRASARTNSVEGELRVGPRACRRAETTGEGETEMDFLSICPSGNGEGETWRWKSTTNGRRGEGEARGTDVSMPRSKTRGPDTTRTTITEEESQAPATLAPAIDGALALAPSLVPAPAPVRNLVAETSLPMKTPKSHQKATPSSKPPRPRLGSVPLRSVTPLPLPSLLY